MGSSKFIAERSYRARNFCLHDGELVALHGFIKKSQKTQKRDLELATIRQKELNA